MHTLLYSRREITPPGDRGRTETQSNPEEMAQKVPVRPRRLDGPPAARQADSPHGAVSPTIAAVAFIAKGRVLLAIDLPISCRYLSSLTKSGQICA